MPPSLHPSAHLSPLTPSLPPSIHLPNPQCQCSPPTIFNVPDSYLNWFTKLTRPRNRPFESLFTMNMALIDCEQANFSFASCEISNVIIFSAFRLPQVPHSLNSRVFPNVPHGPVCLCFDHKALENSARWMTCCKLSLMCIKDLQWTFNDHKYIVHIEGILPKGPYVPCVSMAGRALLAGYHRYIKII